MNKWEVMVTQIMNRWPSIIRCELHIPQTLCHKNLICFLQRHSSSEERKERKKNTLKQKISNKKDSHSQNRKLYATTNHYKPIRQMPNLHLITWMQTFSAALSSSLRTLEPLEENLREIYLIAIMRFAMEFTLRFPAKRDTSL